MEANIRRLHFQLALCLTINLCLAKGPPAINIPDVPPPPSNVVTRAPSMNQPPIPSPSNIRQSPRSNQNDWPSPPTGESGFNSNNNFNRNSNNQNQDGGDFGWNDGFDGSQQEGMNDFGPRNWDPMDWHHHHRHHHHHDHWRPWGFGPPPPPPPIGGWFP